MSNNTNSDIQFQLSQQLSEPYTSLAELSASALARLDTSARKQDEDLHSAYEKAILDATNTIFSALYQTIPVDKKTFYQHLHSLRAIRTIQFKSFK